MSANPTHDGCQSTTPCEDEKAGETLTRRQMMTYTGAGIALATTALATRHVMADRAPVFIARNQRYDGPLAQTIRDGLLATGMAAATFRGKNVLLKPNLVEPTRQRPQMTTHPAVIVAIAEVFRDWGATVVVGEAPGHVRDSDMAVQESGMSDALTDAKLKFADLNYQDVQWRKNLGGYSPLAGFYLPSAVLEADFVVSVPKMKTHHWMGMTASMKNLYGVLPGIKYGWPKNVLHHAGIPETVVDIYKSLPPTLTIIDAIDCMEGDGPILGTLKRMGLILVGQNLRAVDATVARIMGLDPTRVAYLALAHRMGPVDDRYIQQSGERWQELANPFKILDRPHLRYLQANNDGPLVT